MTVMSRPVHRTVDASVWDLLHSALRGLADAQAATTAEQRYADAHVAALRAAAAVLADRTRSNRGRPRSVWFLVSRVAPDLAEWCAFFAAGAGRRAAAEAGIRGSVTSREADDLLRDARAFCQVVIDRLGVNCQVPLDVR